MTPPVVERAFSRTLVVPGFNICDALKIDDPKKVEWKGHLIDSRGRDLERAVLNGAVLPRADLTGAHLQGTSLRASHLQGAVLDRANLLGASLADAQLQAATLISAQLQGTSLRAAQAQGAMLDRANLQGAGLDFALLHGAKLFGALLWRTELTGSIFENIFDAGGEVNWSSIAWGANETGAPTQPWTDATYAKLHQFIEQEVSEGHLRSAALSRLAILDCRRTNDNTHASCDPWEPPPDAVQQWKNRVEGARIDRSSYAKALAAILGDLLCTEDDPDFAIMAEAGIVSSLPPASATARGSIQMTTPPAHQ